MAKTIEQRGARDIAKRALETTHRSGDRWFCGWTSECRLPGSRSPDSVARTRGQLHNEISAPYTLLGMAIKYAGLRGKEVRVNRGRAEAPSAKTARSTKRNRPIRL
jgi:hypothetical protein